MYPDGLLGQLGHPLKPLDEVKSCGETSGEGRGAVAGTQLGPRDAPSQLQLLSLMDPNHFRQIK